MRARAPRESCRRPAFGFPSASPPIHVPKRSGAGASGQVPAVVGEQLLRRVDEALLEEPVPVADLVDDARPPRAHLVGLPVRRDLRGERALDLGAARRREQRVVELGEQRGDAQVRREHRPPRRLGRMRRQDELQRDPPLELLGRDALEPRERVVERLAPARAPRACTRAAGGRGGAARRRSRAGSTARTRAARSPAARAAAPRPPRWSSSCGAPARDGARERPDPLDVLEQRLALLLDEHPPEQVAEQPDVAAERRISCFRRLHCLQRRLEAPQNRTIRCLHRRWTRPALASNHGSHALRQGLGEPPRRARRRAARTALRRPAPRPRGHLAAGVRGPAPRRPHGAPARPDPRDDGPQRRHGRRHADGRALGAAARGARA